MVPSSWQATQFNLLDSAAAFAIVFWTLGALSIPTAWVGDYWFLIPTGFLLAGSLAYVGAMATAREHGTLLAAAYDLYRFDMMAGLHLALPMTPEQERSSNEMLTDFLRYADAFVVAPDVRRYRMALSYEHDALATDHAAGSRSGRDGDDGDPGKVVEAASPREPVEAAVDDSTGDGTSAPAVR